MSFLTYTELRPLQCLTGATCSNLIQIEHLITVLVQLPLLPVEFFLLFAIRPDHAPEFDKGDRGEFGPQECQGYAGIYDRDNVGLDRKPERDPERQTPDDEGKSVLADSTTPEPALD